MSHFDSRLSEILPALEARRKHNRAWRQPRAFYEAIGDGFRPTLWAGQACVDGRKRAKRKKLDWALTTPWIIRRLEQQEYRCAVSGIKFSSARPQGSHKRPWMPSLDRIDCARGYTPDNVRIVCVAVNTLLQDWGDSVFHEIIAASK